MDLLPYFLAAIAGIACGWLTNFLAERFPRDDRPLFGAMHCVRCAHRLTPLQLVPLLGYAIQRGRCRFCHKAIPWRFPAVELLLAAAFCSAWPIYAGHPLYVYIVNIFFIFLLAVIALIDWQYRLIYPIMIYIGCAVGLLVALLSGPHKDNILPDGVGSVLIGALLGGGIFYLIYLIALVIYKRRALGFGDVLLAILIGVILGFPRAISALFLGAVLGGVVAIFYFLFGGKRWRDFIPYGTTLCLGVILIIIFGQAIWQWGPFGILTGLLQLFFTIIIRFIFGPGSI